MPKNPASYPIHFPASFYKQVSIDVHKNMFGNIQVNTVYDLETIDNVMALEDTTNDATRTVWQFGSAEPRAYNKSDVPITDNMRADAQLNGIELTTNDARALIAFNSSIDKVGFQGGIFNIGSVMLKDLLQRLKLQMNEFEFEAILTVTKDGKGNLLVTNSLTAPISLVSLFVLSLENGLYKLNLQSEKISNNPNFMERQVLPKVNDVITKEEELAIEDLFLIVPFLGDVAIRKQFDKRVKDFAPDMKLAASQYITLCYENDAVLCEKILNALKLPKYIAGLEPAVVLPVTPPPLVTVTDKAVVQTVVPDLLPTHLELDPLTKFEVANKNLISLIEDSKIDEELRDQASDLHTAIMSLSERQRKKNLPLLTKVMEGASNVITLPSEESIAQYRALMAPIINNKWRKIAIAMAAVIIGAAVIAVSTALAVASFGATSVLSAIGIYIGASVLIKASTIASGAIGLVLLAGGLALAHDRALKNVTSASTPFWQQPSPRKVPEVKPGNMAQVAPFAPSPK